METVDFRVRLATRQEKVGSLLCVGLDLDIDEMPEHVKNQFDSLEDEEERMMVIIAWAKSLVDSTAAFACMYKPQIAHWEALGTKGLWALTHVVSYVKKVYPEIVVLLDCKRGDIDNTQTKYMIACFEKYGADGVNFNPYMGKSCLKALYDQNHPERALVGLCFTSNEDARETQDVVLSDGDMYWQFIAKRTLKWCEDLGEGVLNNAGLVIAAAYVDKGNPGVIHDEHLVSCREIVGDKLWFLIPGIGKQGGVMKETIRSSFVGYGSIAINESRSVIFASKGEDFAEAAGRAAEKSCNSMKEVLSEIGY